MKSKVHMKLFKNTIFRHTTQYGPN